MQSLPRNKNAARGAAPAVSMAARLLLVSQLAYRSAAGQDATAPSSLVRVAHEDSPSVAAKSCVTRSLGERLAGSHPRRLPFDDIDAAAAFRVVPQSLEIEFALAFPTHGWIGFGVSEVGSMKGADVAVIEPREDGTFALTDRYSKDYAEPAVDKIQNWELLDARHETVRIDCERESDLPGAGPVFKSRSLGQMEESEVSVTIAVVRRMLDTCDGEDEPLTPDLMQNYFIAAYGEDHQTTLQFHSKRSSVVEYVHTPEPLIPRTPKGKSVLDIVTPRMEIPPGVTNYCYSRVTIDRPIVLTAYSAVNTTNLHHIILYKATERLDAEGGYVCGEKQMGSFRFGWAAGKGRVVFPGDLHMRLDPGEYFFESHFENPAAAAFAASPALRVHVHEDASQLDEEGEMMMILLDGRFEAPIPAGRGRVERGFELPPECLDGLPREGVTVMLNVAHMHETGTAMRVYRERGGQNDLVLDQRAFDFDKQNPIWKSWTILPGDRVRWKCAWDTADATEPLPWGIASRDEMCVLFLLTSKGVPFDYAASGIGHRNGTLAYCGADRLPSEEGELLAHLDAPPADAVLVEIDPAPPQEAFVEKGRRWNVCQSLVRAELVPPANNFLLGSPVFYFILCWIIQVIGRWAIARWCRHHSIRRSGLWIAEKSLMFMEMVVCTTVLCLVLSDFKTHFAIETDKVYEVAGEIPLGHGYRSITSAATILACSYVVTIMIKASLQLNFFYDAIHHGVALTAIFLVCNAADFGYALSLITFLGSCMLLHASSTAPVFACFLLLKLNPNPARYNRALAVLFVGLAVVKQCVMILAHAASVYNYRLFFQEQTFRLREVTADWNERPYSEIRLAARDRWMDAPWIAICEVVFPILWVILFGVQLYMTRRQLQIGAYEYRKTYGDKDRSRGEAPGRRGSGVEGASTEDAPGSCPDGAAKVRRANATAMMAVVKEETMSSSSLENSLTDDTPEGSSNGASQGPQDEATMTRAEEGINILVRDFDDEGSEPRRPSRRGSIQMAARRASDPLRASEGRKSFEKAAHFDDEGSEPRRPSRRGSIQMATRQVSDSLRASESRKSFEKAARRMSSSLRSSGYFVESDSEYESEEEERKNETANDVGAEGAEQRPLRRGSIKKEVQRMSDSLRTSGYFVESDAEDDFEDKGNYKDKDKGEDEEDDKCRSSMQRDANTVRRMMVGALVEDDDNKEAAGKDNPIDHIV